MKSSKKLWLMFILLSYFNFAHAIDSDGDGMDDGFDAFPADATRWTDSSIGEIPGSASISASGELAYQIPVVLPPHTGAGVPALSIQYDRNAARGLIGEGWCVVGLGLSNGNIDDSDEMASPTRGRIDGASAWVGTGDAPSLARTNAFSTANIGGAQTSADNAHTNRGADTYAPDKGITQFGKTNVADDARITRCKKTRAQDGQYRPVQFDSNDKFCLNGNRPLVAINGVYGANGTEYRLEKEEFTKVVSYGSQGNGPAYFKAWNKNGDIHEFGNTADSRIEAQGMASVAIWAVNKVSDRHGNYYAVNYFEDNTTGEYFVDAIHYTGNASQNMLPNQTIDFIYETRPDVEVRYQGGAKSTLSHRLTRIVTGRGEYRFTYAGTVHAWDKSRVIKIEHCDAAGSCLGATSIDWGDEKRGWVYNENATRVDNDRVVFTDRDDGDDYGTRLGDLNGDGLPDLIQLRDDHPRRVWLNTGRHFVRSDSFANSLADDVNFVDNGDDAESRGTRLADLNGDGLADLIKLRDAHPMKIILNNGTQFIESPNWPNALTSDMDFVDDDSIGRDYGTRLMDVNADGLTDLVKLRDTNTRRIFINTGSGFVQNTAWANTIHGDMNFANDDSAGSDYATRIADLNGDGYPDLIKLRKDNTFKAMINTGSSFVNVPAWVVNIHPDAAFRDDDNAEDEGMRLADLNNDGLPDLIQLRDGDAQIRRVYLNNGSTFIQSPVWEATIPGNINFVDDGQTAEDRGARLADLNGDGLPDLIKMRDAHARLVYLNTGAGFVNAPTWANSIGSGESFVNDDSSGEDRGTRIADINGDGLPELLSFRRELGKVVYMNTGTQFVRTTDYFTLLDTTATTSGGAERPDAIKRIVTGLGKETNIIYGYLSDTSLYTPGGAIAYPLQNTAEPGLPVVKRMESTNAVGGMNAVEYRYTGLRKGLTGRGLAGFASQSVVDGQSQIETVTGYRQDYPYTGLEDNRARIDATGKILDRQSNTYSYTESQPGVFLVNPVSRSLWRCNLDAPCVSGQEESQYLIKTTSSAIFDSFGNATNITVTMRNLAGDQLWESNTTNAYTNDELNWLLGLRTRQTTALAQNGQTGASRVVAFEYDPVTGSVIKKVIEPDRGAPFRQQTDWVRDGFGNITSTTLSGPDFTSRTTTQTYDSRGLFMVSEANALGHLRVFTYDANLGKMSGLTDENNLTTSYEYDGFGHPVKESRPDGTSTVYGTIACSSCQNGEYIRAEQSSGQTPEATTFSVLQLPVQHFSVGFKGDTIYRDYTYDQRSRLVHRSAPYYDGDTVYGGSFSYDNFDRMVTEVWDDGTGGTYTNARSYDGLTVTETDRLGRDKITVRDIRNRIITTTDAANTPLSATMQYTYDPWDNVVTTMDPDGNTITLGYDTLGRMVTSDDPDMGLWTRSYNGLGDLVTQTDAKNQTTTLSYDVLGRTTQRVKPDGTDTFVYDTASGKGTGKMASRASTNGVAKSYGYDALGRPTQTDYFVDGNHFTTNSSYDSLGRLRDTTYPSINGQRFKVRRVYNNRGYLLKIRIPGGTEFWRVAKANAFGETTKAVLGNGATGLWTYNPANNWVQTLKTKDSSGALVQHLQLIQDSMGNLTQRTDKLQVFSEHFSYDDLDRLVQSSIAGGLPSQHSTKTVSYDILGNITSKSEAGSYSYGGSCNGIVAGPHAVTNVSGSGPHSGPYCYDNNGNMLSGGGRAVTYTSFNKPAQISQNGTTVTWTYDAAHKKAIREVGDKRTVHAGKFYERITDSVTGEVAHVHYIRFDNATVATLTKRINGATVTDEWEYLHRDHLDSVDVVTDDSGIVKHRQHYDPWGLRRADDWSDSSGPFALVNTRRGFTDHEMVPEVGLIHMKGRVYNPALGRFLSADPFIQSPDNSQSYNRYSYVFNNPMKYTDPSGYRSAWKNWLLATAGVLEVAAGATLQAVPGGQGVGIVLAGVGVATTATAVSDLTTGASAQPVGGNNNTDGNTQSPAPAPNPADDPAQGSNVASGSGTGSCTNFCIGNTGLGESGNSISATANNVANVNTNGYVSRRSEYVDSANDTSNLISSMEAQRKMEANVKVMEASKNMFNATMKKVMSDDDDDDDGG